MRLDRNVAAAIAFLSTSGAWAQTDASLISLKLTRQLSLLPAPRVAPQLFALNSIGFYSDIGALDAAGGDDGVGSKTEITTTKTTTTNPPASQVNPLSSFNTSTTNGSSLVTAHIATAYAPAFREPNGDNALFKNGVFFRREAKKSEEGVRDLRYWNAIGVDISASLPAQSATLKDYGKQALLTLDGGVINVLGAFAGRNEKVGVPVPDPRVVAFDHVYLLGADENQMLMYVKQGIGGRAVKTALQGNGYAGLGTAYLGFGVDGPLLSTRAGSSDPNSGWIMLEAYATANVINPSTLNKLFQTDTKTHSLPVGSARFRIGLPGRFYLSAEYSKAFGTFGKKVGDVAVISFGYNSDTKTTATEKKTVETTTSTNKATTTETTTTTRTNR